MSIYDRDYMRIAERAGETLILSLRPLGLVRQVASGEYRHRGSEPGSLAGPRCQESDARLRSCGRLPRREHQLRNSRRARDRPGNRTSSCPSDYFKTPFASVDRLEDVAGIGPRTWRPCVLRSRASTRAGNSGLASPHRLEKHRFPVKLQIPPLPFRERARIEAHSHRHTHLAQRHFVRDARDQQLAIVLKADEPAIK